jgi:hypothetical protein
MFVDVRREATVPLSVSDAVFCRFAATTILNAPLPTCVPDAAFVDEYVLTVYKSVPTTALMPIEHCNPAATVVQFGLDVVSAYGVDGWLSVAPAADDCTSVKTTDAVDAETVLMRRFVLLVDEDPFGIVITKVAGATAALCELVPPPPFPLFDDGFGAGALLPPPPPPQATTLSPAIMPSAITLERLNIGDPRNRTASAHDVLAHEPQQIRKRDIRKPGTPSGTFTVR